MMAGIFADVSYSQDNKYERSYKNYLEKVNQHIQSAQKKLSYVKEKFKFDKEREIDFYVVSVIRDSVGRWEQVYLKIDYWNKNIIKATLSSHMNVVDGYIYGTNFIIEEDKVIDWLIIYPNGEEEGNFIVRSLKSKSG